MPRYTCEVKDITPLRMPGINRINCTENEKLSIDIELPEQVYSLSKGDNVEINVVEDKKECLEYEFCGVGHVVSITKLDNQYRAIISIGGLLLVIKTPDDSLIKDLKVVEKYYIGIKRLT